MGTLNLDQIAIQALPTPEATLTPLPTLHALPSPTPTIDPPVYRTSLVIIVRVRLAGAGTTPVAPRTPVSQQARIEQIKKLLDQARLQDDWSYSISLLLALRQLGSTDPSIDPMLIEAYLNDGQRRFEAGQYDQAGADWQAVLEIDPANATATTKLSLLEVLTPTPTPTVTPTPSPSSTPTPSLTPTIGPTPWPYYVLNLAATGNNRYPQLGCTWFGFFGRITTASNYPVVGLTVQVSASGFEGVRTTTNASGDYEIYLDNKPRAERWIVELYQNDQSVASPVEVDSHANCGSNQIEMDWRRGF